jgi:predicted secreted protein
VTAPLFSLAVLTAPLWVFAVADQSAGTLVLSNGDDGKSFNVSVGEKVEVELASAAGTGYTWVCKQEPAPLLTAEGVRRVQVDRALGGAQKHIHSFATNAAGKVQITCNLVRPWERDAKPAQTVKIELEVKSP